MLHKIVFVTLLCVQITIAQFQTLDLKNQPWLNNELLKPLTRCQRQTNLPDGLAINENNLNNGIAIGNTPCDNGWDGNGLPNNLAANNILQNMNSRGINLPALNNNNVLFNGVSPIFNGINNNVLPLNNGPITNGLPNFNNIAMGNGLLNANNLPFGNGLPIGNNLAQNSFNNLATRSGLYNANNQPFGNGLPNTGNVPTNFQPAVTNYNGQLNNGIQNLNSLPASNAYLNTNNLPVANFMPNINSVPIPNSFQNVNNMPGTYNLPINNLPVNNIVPNANNNMLIPNKIANLPQNNWPIPNSLQPLNFANYLPSGLANMMPVMSNLPIPNRESFINNFANGFGYNLAGLPVNNLPFNGLQGNNFNNPFTIATNIPLHSIVPNLNNLPGKSISQSISFLNPGLNNGRFVNEEFKMTGMPVNGIQRNNNALANNIPYDVALNNLQGNTNGFENNFAGSNCLQFDNLNFAKDLANNLQIEGFGNLPMLNGLPVAGITETVTVLNSPCR